MSGRGKGKVFTLDRVGLGAMTWEESGGVKGALREKKRP